MLLRREKDLSAVEEEEGSVMVCIGRWEEGGVKGSGMVGEARVRVVARDFCYIFGFAVHGSSFSCAAYISG